ncbi:MAG: HEAT repeat domain-containing protein [Deltaproteobacteria bacterium]|nr:HEAT repeat domain-containing protein [Deltaproteobacteria bacterium]
MPDNLTTEIILIEFAKSVKAIAFYPEGHPNREAVVEKTFNLLQEFIKENGNIKVAIESAGFLEGRTPIGRNHKPVQGLAKELFLKRVREITFTEDATLKEWEDLTLILSMDADSFKKGGGLEKMLVVKEIKGIQLNEMRYDDIRKKVIELEEAKKKTEIVEEEEMAEAVVAEEEEGKKEDEVTHSVEEQLKAIEENKETLEILLDKLEKEEDTISYNALAQKIADKAKPMHEESNWEGLFPVLVVFAAHSSPENKRHPEQKAIASDRIRELLHNYMIDYLITRLCNHHEEWRQEIQEMLRLLGEEAMKQLLAKLINTEEAHTRRQIFNTLAIFGEMARIEAEKQLDDKRWFVARQMVSLLGEIGSPHSLDAVKKAFGHRDDRVKKEVLKTIGKIQSNESAAFLLQKLDVHNASIKMQAVISLGVLKAANAVEPLGYLALKRGFSDENIEIRKEAVRSIGMIGGDNAAAFLKKALKKQVFWGKKQNDEVRSVAAIALGKIGGKDAMETLAEVSMKSKGIVQIACKKAMEGK